jgi:hypothetical protein
MPYYKKLLKQIGPYCFARYCKNNGISFIDCYQMMFNKLPRDFNKNPMEYSK